MLVQYKNYFSAVATSLATLLAIGQFKQVSTPIRVADTSQPIRSLVTIESQKNSNSSPIMADRLHMAKEGALWGMLIADAMSMPVHWYYNPDDIKRGYGGWLKGFTAPSNHHPSSILTLSATDGSGRTGWHKKSTQIIGNVILHDKLKYWQSGDRSTHYHQGMKAGDNTLNSVVAVEFLKSLQKTDPGHNKPGKELRGILLEDYVRFMTTPGSHNDTYAESFHRLFFKDWYQNDKKLLKADELLTFVEERYTEKSKYSSDSQLVVIGAMSPAIPWILHNAHKSEEECVREVVEFIKCTHPAPDLIPYVDLYSRLLHGVIQGHDLKQEVMRLLSHSKLGGRRKQDQVQKLLDRAASFPKGSEERLKAYQRATQTLGSACYIEGALSSMLFLAYEFADDFEAGVLGNANCGGENCHRGAALGALLGAHAVNTGKEIPRHLKDGLGARQEVLSLLQEQSKV